MLNCGYWCIFESMTSWSWNWWAKFWVLWVLRDTYQFWWVTQNKNSPFCAVRRPVHVVSLKETHMLHSVTFNAPLSVTYIRVFINYVTNELVFSVKQVTLLSFPGFEKNRIAAIRPPTAARYPSDAAVLTRLLWIGLDRQDAFQKVRMASCIYVQGRLTVRDRIQVCRSWYMISGNLLLCKEGDWWSALFEATGLTDTGAVELTAAVIYIPTQACQPEHGRWRRTEGLCSW